MIADAGFRSPVEPLHASHVAAVPPRRCSSCRWASCSCWSSVPSTSPTFCSSERPRRVKELAVRQALGAGRRHIVAEVTIETTLLTMLGALAGLTLRCRGHSPVGRARQQSAASRGASELRRPGRDRRAGDSGRGGPRHGRSDRLVQPSQPRRGHPAVAHAGRHGQPHRPAPAPWISRGADRAVVRPARRGWAARHQPAQGDGRAARISAGTRADRAGFAAVGTVLPARASVLASSPG